MHYPSDVLAGVALGTLVGGLVPGVGERPLEERMADLVHERAGDQSGGQ
jgi:membrane-associated phospholipid phosphatase